MNLALQQLITLVSKDIRIEARSKQIVSLVMVLGILIVTVLGLGLKSQAKVNGAAASSILWVAYLFGGVLCFEKTMAFEQHDGAMAGLMLAPVDRGILFAAKLISNLVLMFLLALVVTPVAVLLFSFDLSTAPWQFMAVMGLSFIGYASIGTLFAAAVSSSQLHGVLAMVIFPLALPLVIASTQLTFALFDKGQPVGFSGFTLLASFDVVYLVVSWLVFELILEP